MPNRSQNEIEGLNFHNACATGNLRVVKTYVAEERFDMNIVDGDGKNGFNLACLYGKLNVVQLLVQQGIDVNVGDNHGSTGFHWACRCGKLNVVQFLVQQAGIDMNLVDTNGRTGFHFACLNGKLNVVKFLLQRGFDWNLGGNSGRTGFHLACFNEKLNVVEFLVEHGFDMNVADNAGNTGFHFACRYGSLNVVEFFLQQKFEGINDLCPYGETGLQILMDDLVCVRADELYMPCVLLLIEAGAEFDKNNIFEELLCAIQNRIIEITSMKEIIFEKWTGRIAQEISDFTMDPFTNRSLQNLSQFLD